MNEVLSIISVILFFLILYVLYWVGMNWDLIRKGDKK